MYPNNPHPDQTPNRPPEPQPTYPQQPSQPYAAPQQPQAYYSPQPGQPPADRSINYLNQIAATPARRVSLPSPRILLGIIIVGVLALLIIGFMLFNSQPSMTGRLTSLYLRLQTLQAVASDEQSDLKDTSLRTVNSNLSILLTNSLRDTESALTKRNIKVNAISQTSKKTEQAYQTKLTDELTDAKLNVALDSTYAREMAYQLSIVHSMMKTIYNSTNNSDLKSTLSTTNNNLEAIQQSFESFSGSKE